MNGNEAHRGLQGSSIGGAVGSAAFNSALMSARGHHGPSRGAHCVVPMGRVGHVAGTEPSHWLMVSAMPLMLDWGALVAYSVTAVCVLALNRSPPGMFITRPDPGIPASQTDEGNSIGSAPSGMRARVQSVGSPEQAFTVKLVSFTSVLKVTETCTAGGRLA